MIVVSRIADISSLVTQMRHTSMDHVALPVQPLVEPLTGNTCIHADAFPVVSCAWCLIIDRCSIKTLLTFTCKLMHLSVKWVGFGFGTITPIEQPIVVGHW